MLTIFSLNLQQDSAGRTPLEMAESLRCEEAVKVLSIGQDVNILCDALSAIHLQDFDIFDPSAGPKVNVNSRMLRYGCTLIFLATEN